VWLDRNRHGGGVAIYIKSLFLFFLVTYLSVSSLVFLLVPVNCVFSCFIDLPIVVLTFLIVFIVPYVGLIFLYFPIIFVLVGDFNVDLSTSSHPLSPKLHNIASSFILSQIVTQPTHFSHAGTPSLIDLVFVSSPINVASCQTVPPLSNSDHLCIHLTYKVTHSSRRPRSGPREVWQYSIGDFEKSLWHARWCHRLQPSRSRISGTVPDF